MEKIHYSDPTLEAWLNGVMYPMKPDLFVTFVFNGLISLESAQTTIRKWHDLCDLKIIGPGYTECRKQRTAGAVVFEHLLTNLHGHAAIRAAKHDKKTLEDLKAIYERVWKKRVPRGSLDIQDANPATRPRMLDYMKKEWRRPGFFEDILIL